MSKDKKSVLDNARSHFRSALSQELQSVEVLFLGSYKELTIHRKPFRFNKATH